MSRQLNGPVADRDRVVICIDAQGRVLAADSQAAGLLGCAPESLVAGAELAAVAERAGLAPAFVDWLRHARAAGGTLPVPASSAAAGVVARWLPMAGGAARLELSAPGDGVPPQQADRLLEQVLDAIPSPVFYKDADGRYLGCNVAFQDYIGIPRGQLVGRTVFDISPPELAKVYFAADRDLIERTGKQVYEAAVRYADGSHHHVMFNKATFEDADGSTGGLVGVMLDITERKTLERELTLSATVFDNAVEAIMITDATARILKVNRAFELITGYRAEEVIGERPSLLSSGRQTADYYATMWGSLAKDGRWFGEIWNRRKTGEEYPEWLSITAVKDAGGQVSHYIGIFTDITQRKHSEATIERLTKFDSLTGLTNRDCFLDQLTLALEEAAGPARPLGVLLAGLDRMRAINDSLGFAVGDTVMREAARRLQAVVGEDGLVARYVGDQFVILPAASGVPEALADLATQLLDALALPFHVGGHELNISSSIGIGIAPRDARDPVGLLKCADMAMQHAKKEGRNNYQFYTSDLEHASVERLRLQAGLRHGLLQDQFVLHYQPQIDLDSGRMVGAEALVRWRHPEMGMISPARFIPLAEETGQIIPLGDWVLRTACREARRWHDAGHPITIAVNLSARQFKQNDLPDKVAAALRASGLPPEALELELTESMIMQDPERVVACLHELRELGIRLSVDDFGTGYSSLAYLKRFPINKLKIDRSFVAEIPHDQSDMAIAQAVIALGRSMRLTVIAEGVETAAQAEFLCDQGCHGIQGYYYSPPVSAEAMALMLYEQQQANVITVQ